jgi:hypothetical protein
LNLIDSSRSTAGRKVNFPVRPNRDVQRSILEYFLRTTADRNALHAGRQFPAAHILIAAIR